MVIVVAAPDGPEGAVCCAKSDILAVGVCRAITMNWTTAYMTQLWVALLIPILSESLTRLLLHQQLP